MKRQEQERGAKRRRIRGPSETHLRESLEKDQPQSRRVKLVNGQEENESQETNVNENQVEELAVVLHSLDEEFAEKERLSLEQTRCDNDDVYLSLCQELNNFH
jgi:hypothetical protein